MWKTKNMNVDNSWKLKFIYCLVEITDEPLHVDKCSTYKFYLNPCLIWRISKYADGANIEVMLGQTEPLRKIQ